MAPCPPPSRAPMVENDVTFDNTRCIITKDGLKFKRDVLNQQYRRQLRHNYCKEVKEMLSGELVKR